MNFTNKMSDGFVFSNLFLLVFGFIFLMIIGIFIYTIVRGLGQYHRNNNSPKLTVSAKIVTKRADVDVRRHAGDNHSHTSYTTYYLTFEFESGDRIEFVVDEQDYGLLVEGDQGSLTFQGTRFIGFKRI